ncbi:hypothetical protein K435DRAFT_804987 [Dendrothele bispora CBS 962.96]|uniref:Uncharacterized protein n=1 Tax=Dendrothele bispora (strain CBS 962.96) TaxID=1314807 RepID=A0A4S8LCK2_DENBC|nr:hypothetical protein K435DRAFT_804987 [Dendrothele bispora CBS 962.96]
MTVHQLYTIMLYSDPHPFGPSLRSWLRRKKECTGTFTVSTHTSSCFAFKNIKVETALLLLLPGGLSELDGPMSRETDRPEIVDEMSRLLGQLGVLFRSPDSPTFVNKSIARHMRFLLPNTEDRIRERTTYPSEHVLSNAAADFMHSDEEVLSYLLECLVKKTPTGLINACWSLLADCSFSSVETLLLSRVMIFRLVASYLKTYVLLSSRSIPFPNSNEAFFSYLRPVPLLDVLDILLGLQWSSGCDIEDEIESPSSGLTFLLRMVI